MYYDGIADPGRPNLNIMTLAVPRNQVARHTWHAVVFPCLAQHLAPDVVHLPNTLPLFISFRKVVSTIHDVYEFDVPEAFNTFSSMYRRLILRSQSRCSDRIITDSNYSRQRLAETLLIRDPKTVAIWLGPSWDHDNSFDYGLDSNTAWSLSFKANYILFVGTITRHKNVCTLLQSFRILLDEGFSSHHLVIVGRPGNAWEEMWKTIYNLSLQDTVHYLADVNDKELRSLYRHAKVFAMPSLMEGFGFPAVDAMSMGIPVITSDRGSLPEICGTAACLVDPLDIRGIANALQLVISDHSFRDALAQRSLERSKLFSWEETAKKTHLVYENVTG